MSAGRALFLAAALVGSLVCVRLALWQWGRMNEKRAANAAIERQLAAAPVEIGGRAPGTWPEGRVAMSGRFLADRHVLLRGRMEEGEPGVELLTPFRLAEDSTLVLVDRGWLPAEDGATLELARIPVDTSRRVVGLPRSFETGPPIPPMRALGVDSLRAWSAPRAVRDSVALRIGASFAPIVLRQLPGPEGPSLPRRHAPHVEGESMHLGYVIQWCAMALLIPIVAWFASRRRPGRRPPLH